MLLEAHTGAAVPRQACAYGQPGEHRSSITCAGTSMYGMLHFGVCSSMPYIHSAGGVDRQLRCTQSCMSVLMQEATAMN